MLVGTRREVLQFCFNVRLIQKSLKSLKWFEEFEMFEGSKGFEMFKGFEVSLIPERNRRFEGKCFCY